MNRPSVVFGDVHGHPDRLQRLLSIIHKRFGKDVDIYSTGDLIDRGPDSRGVIDICIQHGVKAVMGNHEEWLYHYLNTGKFNGFALSDVMGGKATLSSYGLHTTTTIERDLKQRIPREHQDYILSMPLWIHFQSPHRGLDDVMTRRDYWLSHGGLTKASASPFINIFKQETGRDPEPHELLDIISQIKPELLLWVPSKPHDANLQVLKGGTQIFGHTPVRKPVIHQAYIAVDTGCGLRTFNGCLSAVILPDMEVITS